MRRNSKANPSKIILSVIILLALKSPLLAQVDTSAPVKTDTVSLAKTDTVIVPVSDTTVVVEEANEKKKKKNEFIFYAGANVNHMNISSDKADARSAVGFHIGAAYKQGRFFYWQVGAKYNNSQYNFVNKSTSLDSGKLSLSAFEIPLTVGINFLSFVNRAFALRAFVSAVPSFTLGVGDNTLNFSKSNVNPFVFYGQGGIGVNIAFFLIEFGYNYGFQDLLDGYDSNPGQAFISLGFRF